MSMSFPRVLVVVLNYKGETVLIPCLRSLVTGLGSGDKMLVIDHGQETKLMQQVEKLFPQVEVLTPATNGGFAQGMNRGLHVALEKGFDAAWIVNNDVVASSETLMRLKSALNTYGDQALFSPVITTPSGNIWFAGGVIAWMRMRVNHNTEYSGTGEPFLTNFLTGCALFIPTAIVKKVGFLDERYFLYYEDAEYSERVQRSGGKLVVVPQARVIHSEESKKNPAKIYWLVRSGTIFFLTQSSGWKKNGIRVIFFLRRAKNWLECILRPGPVAESVKQAYTDALKSLHV